MAKYKKQLIVLLLIVIELTSIFFAYKSFSNKDVISIKETTKIDKKRFAMYAENMDGEYEEVSDTNFFSVRYLLNQEKTTCVDNKGERLDNVITYNNNQITVTSNKTLFCYLYFDMKIDFQVDVETDGEAGVVPTTLGYNKSITCEDGTTPTWNYKYNRLEFTGINKAETECNLIYTKYNNTYKTLKDVVENDDSAYHEIYTMKDYEKGIALEENEYSDLEMYYNNSFASTTGTEVTNGFEFDDEYWNTIPENLTDNNYYHIQFVVQDEDYYQLCYNLSKGHSFNYMYIYINDVALISRVSASETNEVSGCVEVGYLDSNDVVRVVQEASTYSYNDTTHEIAKVSFKLQKADTKEHYRYNGKNPNNYVWFNNEVWRIIGSLPVKDESGELTNLVKIIRNDSIGVIDYEVDWSNFEGAWGDNTLFKLLNEYYFGKKNGTESGYCYGYTPNNYSTKSNCDYSINGILSESYYGKMIEPVYWNNGLTTTTMGYQYTPREFLSYESSSQLKTLAYIGLMTASDYGYSANSDRHENDIHGQVTANTSWIYGKGGEWTNSQYSNNSIVSINSIGSIENRSGYYGSSVRPAVYLDSSVYVIDGNGTEENPYQLAID